jgi:hypothetical protein
VTDHPRPAAPTAGRAATPRAELWLYAGAAASYIISGFALKQIFAWWWFGAAWFIAFVWLVPEVIDKIRRGRADDRRPERAGEIS